MASPSKTANGAKPTCIRSSRNLRPDRTALTPRPLPHRRGRFCLVSSRSNELSGPKRRTASPFTHRAWPVTSRELPQNEWHRIDSYRPEDISPLSIPVEIKPLRFSHLCGVFSETYFPNVSPVIHRARTTFQTFPRSLTGLERPSKRFPGHSQGLNDLPNASPVIHRA